MDLTFTVNSETFGEAMDILMNQYKNPEDLFNNDTVMKSFLLISHTVAHYTYSEFLRNQIKDKNLELYISNMIMYLFEKRNEMDFEQQVNYKKALTIQEPGKKYAFIFGFCIYVTNLLNSISVDICTNFVINKGLEGHAKFLGDVEFVKKHKDSQVLDCSGPHFIIAFIALNMSAMSKNAEETLKIWMDLDTVNIALNVCKMDDKTKMSLYAVISNIANDKKLEELEEISEIIKNLIQDLEKVKSMIESNTITKRKGEVYEDNKKYVHESINIYQNDNTSRSMLFSLRGLYKLSVNQKIKNEIYFSYNVKSLLKCILPKANEIESKYILRLLAQLSFNEDIVQDMLNDKELLDLIEQTVSSKNDVNNEYKLKELSDRIKWNLHSGSRSTKSIDPVSGTNQHVMISYNTASRDVCLNIKSRLESCGFRVWIDVNDIHGSSLDAMASAVEGSLCVLICITEKYRQSINCQSEAQYAFKLRKPIVPLIMQQGYENVTGWLGMIIGDKIFINFTKYDFDECIKRLKKELDRLAQPPKVIPMSSHSSVHLTVEKAMPTFKSSQNEESDFENWDQKRVSEWFEQNSLDKTIWEKLSPWDGKVLKQLLQMNREAPEFFYNMLKDEKVNMKSIVFFTMNLKKLTDT